MKDRQLREIPSFNPNYYEKTGREKDVITLKRDREYK